MQWPELFAPPVVVPARCRRRRPLRPAVVPLRTEDELPFRDRVYRARAGGGYRILRQPRLLDEE